MRKRRQENLLKEGLGWVGLAVKYTLPETNSKFAPENGWLEDYFPFGMASW